MTRKNFLTVLIVLILVGITAYFVVESLIPSSPFIPEYSATYGVYRIPVYYPNNTITYLTVEGVKLTLNNQDQNALQISSVYNSTFKVVPPWYYETEGAPLPNASASTVYVQAHEIYLGVETVIVPLKLSPGVYTIVFSDGNTFNFNVSLSG